MDRIVMYEDYFLTSRTICVDFELPNETLRYWWYQGWYTHHTGSARTQNYSTTPPKWKVVLCFSVVTRHPVPIQAYVARTDHFLFYSNLQLGYCRCKATLPFPAIMVGKCGLPWSRLSVAGYSLEAEPFRPQVVIGSRKVPAQKGLHGWWMA